MSYSTISTVLFDLDGTIVDSLPDLANGLNVLRASKQLPPLPAEVYRDVVSLGTNALMHKAVGVTPEHECYTRCKSIFHGHYNEHIADESHLMLGIAELIEAIEAKNLLWGVITDKNYELSERLLTKLGLINRCAILLGGDSASARKPDAAPLLLACERLHIKPSQCVYVGDAKRDIECAKNAGVRSVAAMYGYIPADEKPEHWQADFYIDKPHELLGWLFD